MSQYLLIDGKNLLFRAGFASRHLKTSDGRYSGAVYGFINMLCRVRVQYPGAEFIVLWESKKETYRHKIFAGYKQRGTPDGDSQAGAIHQQISGVRAFCKSVGLRWVQFPGLEADDLAGLLAKELSIEGHDILLLSGDKDWWQLAPIRGVTIICEQGSAKDSIITDAHVQSVFGCKAKDLLRLRPFLGDVSDKIPPAKPRLRKKQMLEMLAAGVDPRKPFHDQPKLVRECKGLAEFWPNYQRNYLLMRIARHYGECHLEEPQWNDILQTALCGEPPARHYRTMLRVFADWELSDAMSRKDFIFGLARTG